MTDHSHLRDPTRRDVLVNATKAVGLCGCAAFSATLVSSMGPDAEAVAASVPVDVDLASIKPGDIRKVTWRGKLVLIRRRTAEEIQTAQNPDMSQLLVPEPDARRIKAGHEEWLVVFGNCPHLGCIPHAHEGEHGGWLCPCHGSEFDISGRVTKGPASENLGIPDYAFSKDGSFLRIGVRTMEETV